MKIFSLIILIDPIVKRATLISYGFRDEQFMRNVLQRIFKFVFQLKESFRSLVLILTCDPYNKVQASLLQM